MGAMNSLANIGLNAALSRGKAKDEAKAIAVERDQRVAEVQVKDAADRVVRQQQLKEELARQRALAAGGGTAGGGGSAAAVRRGLQARADTEDALAAQERDLAIQGIRGRASAQKRRNLLEADSQIVRQGVTSAFGVGRSLLEL